MNKKIFGGIFALMCIPGVGPAAYGYNAVKMIHPDSQETIFLLNDQPKVSMEENSLVVETVNNKISCPVTEEGVRFEFHDYDLTYVRQIESDAAVFNMSQEAVEGFNLPPYSKISVYDMRGKTVKSCDADASGYFKISISELPGGSYIFNSNCKKFKFHKK